MSRSETISIVEGLTDFYRERNPDKSDILISDVTDMTSGWETELYAYVLEYKEKGIFHKIRAVARLYSGTFAARKTKHEFNVIARLRRAGYPVPKVYELEASGAFLGKPFLTMELITGKSMMDNFLKSSREALGPLVEVFTRLFADLHIVDCLFVFPEAQKVSNTYSYLEKAIRRNRKEVEEKDLCWLTPILDWLEDRKCEVCSTGLSVLHRDFHPGNIMIRPDGSYVVIDWGASEPGDFRVDLLWTVLLASAFWDLSMGKIILKAYERASSIEVRDANYFEVVAIYRRIMDAVVAFTVGSEEAGMRSGALDQMRKALAHYQRIHGFLEERTGLRLTEFDQLLKTL